MFNQNSILFRAFNFTAIIAFGFGFVFAQDKKDDNSDKATTTATPVVSELEPKLMVVGRSDGGGTIDREDEDDSKVSR